MLNLAVQVSASSTEYLPNQKSNPSTGKKLGTYYLSTLDIDLRKEEFSEKMIARLEKNVEKLNNCLQVSYDETKKGLHVDILTPELLTNEQIYYRG